MIRKILILLIIAAGAFATYVAMLPSDYRIQRSATIAAGPEQVFAQVNNFHNWEKWSPWARLDPNAKTAFAGPSPVKARNSPGTAIPKSARAR